MSRKLETIQKRANLNQVSAVDEKGPGNANHRYAVTYQYATPELKGVENVVLQFQKGPRNEPGSTPGIMDSDLLEIVRDRLKGFQSGDYACTYNEQALLHIEEALMWLNRRVEDRLERQVLGTNEK